MLDVRFQAREVRRRAALGVRPIFKAHQHDVDAIAIGRQGSRRIQEQLENLVVRGDLDAVVEAQFAHPEG